MKSFRQALEAGEFLFTAEAGPPKGVDVSIMLHHAHDLRAKVHAVNVTDNQSSVMRLGSLSACHLLLGEGLEPVFQLTCRDRNRLALQSDLLSAYVLGIRNVLALTGDHVLVGDHPGAKPVFDVDSVQLLQIIDRLNSGRDYSTKSPKGETISGGNELQGTPEFFPGAVVNPELEPLEPQLIKFEKKVQAGAKFFQTQAVFDHEKFARFMNYARQFEVKILAGILLLKSAGMARYLNNFVPGIKVPQHLIDELKSAPNKAEAGIKIAGRQIRELRKLCDGVHVMAIGAEDKVPAILAEAGI